jgi:hypothetical protein
MSVLDGRTWEARELRGCLPCNDREEVEGFGVACHNKVIYGKYCLKQKCEDVLVRGECPYGKLEAQNECQVQKIKDEICDAQDIITYSYSRLGDALSKLLNGKGRCLPMYDESKYHLERMYYAFFKMKALCGEIMGAQTEIGDAELTRAGLSLLDEFDLTTCKAVDVANFRDRLRDFVLNVVPRYTGGKGDKQDGNT